MKKLLYLLLLLPLGFLGSCSDDDDYPSVDVTVTFSNTSLYEDVLYVLDGTDLTVDNITVKATDGSNAALSNLAYYWDGFFQPGLTFGQYPLTIATATQPLGRHMLQFNCGILEVDKSIVYGTFSYPVMIVESETDIPAGAPEIGTYKSVVRVNPQK